MTKRKRKVELVPEEWPHNLERDDFDHVRVNYVIYTYQDDALRRQSKKTKLGLSDLVRTALDQYLFKRRREADLQHRMTAENKFKNI